MTGWVIPTTLALPAAQAAPASVEPPGPEPSGDAASGEVIEIAGSPPAAPGSTALDADVARETAGALGQPFRALALLPGVVTSIEVLIVLESAASCADREPLMAPDDPVPSQLVGLIRRVGDETHFFTPTPVGDYYMEVDTETATAYASPRARFPRVVVAVVPGGDAPVRSCGVLTWR